MSVHKHTPRVSLLIPCFQSQAYIADAIAAALRQTYCHVEIIVAPDDGETYQHLRATFKSPQLRIIAPGMVPGSGAGATRNRAIDAASGEYFAMLDADDLIPENYIEDLMRVAIVDGAAIAPTRYVEWGTNQVVRIPPIHPGMLSLSGFGQLLASVHPLIHRTLEPGYVDGFAEDVIHDGTILSKLGTIRVVNSVSYDIRIREGSACSRGQDAEQAIKEAYSTRIYQILRRPTTIGVHNLTASERAAFADLFRFRAMASDAFSRSGHSSYNKWVAGREAALWDSFTESEYASVKPAPVRPCQAELSTASLENDPEHEGETGLVEAVR